MRSTDTPDPAPADPFPIGTRVAARPDYWRDSPAYAGMWGTVVTIEPNGTLEVRLDGAGQTTQYGPPAAWQPHSEDGALSSAPRQNDPVTLAETDPCPVCGDPVELHTTGELADCARAPLTDLESHPVETLIGRMEAASRGQCSDCGHALAECTCGGQVTADELDGLRSTVLAAFERAGRHGQTDAAGFLRTALAALIEARDEVRPS